MCQRGLACVEWIDMQESWIDILALCAVVVVTAIVDCQLLFKIGRQHKKKVERALLSFVPTFMVVFSIKCSLGSCLDLINYSICLLQSLACAEGVLTLLLLLAESRIKDS